MFASLFGKKTTTESKYIVSVTDPQKNGDNISQYISYKVNVTVNEDGKTTQSTTVRRYKDFVWLHNALFQAFPGTLIPPLPEKAVVGRFTEDFIKERQIGLQDFLKKVVSHKELSQWKHINAFLMGDDESFTDAKEEKIDGRSRTQSLQAGLYSLANTVANAVTGNKEDIELTAEELQIDDLKSYVIALESMILPVSKAYDNLVNANNETAKQWALIGTWCKTVGEYEGDFDDKVTGEVFARLDIAAERTCDSHQQNFDVQNVAFKRSLKECIATLRAVKQMIKTQEQRKQTYTQSMSVLKSRQAKLAEGGQGTADHQLAAIEEAKIKAEKDKEELDKVTETCLIEAVRFRGERKAQFVNIVRQFATLQQENQKQLVTAWQAILPCLETKQGPI